MAYARPHPRGDTRATASAAGWELVAVYDKASNWFAGLEKGFVLMKRPVPTGVEPSCVVSSGGVTGVDAALGCDGSAPGRTSLAGIRTLV